VISGTHAIIFSEDAEAARAFFRNVLGFANVDAGEGWLIFALPPGELAFHPGRGWGKQAAQHELFLMCRDIKQTVDQLKEKGVAFTSGISDEGYGLMTRFTIPGAGEIGLYQPKHPSPLAEFSVIE
jgi:catechol 2,3-dioxygenase-like lactoylglutathione lyase family enzyme